MCSINKRFAIPWIIFVSLEISKELNEFGDIIETDYLVKTVIRKHDEEISELTPQGKLYLAKKQSDKQQLKLFDGE